MTDSSSKLPVAACRWSRDTFCSPWFRAPFTRSIINWPFIQDWILTFSIRFITLYNCQWWTRQPSKKGLVIAAVITLMLYQETIIITIIITDPVQQDLFDPFWSKIFSNTLQNDLMSHQAKPWFPELPVWVVTVHLFLLPQFETKNTTGHQVTGTLKIP